MSIQSKNNLLEGINLDLSPLRMPPNAATFIKNLTDNSNINASGAGQTGFSEYAKTPLEGNQALPISGIPSGDNYCIGFYSSEQTNEGYFFLWNSNGSHTIWVINGDAGTVTCTLVLQSFALPLYFGGAQLLPFIYDPEYFLAEGRVTLELISTTDPTTNEVSNFKLLIFTNNNGQQFMIDVDASIATNGYTTPYFFHSSSYYYDPRELYHLGSGVPGLFNPTALNQSIGLNNPNPYTPTTADASLQNYLINSGWQFRIRTWDIWGRPSEWGVISSVYTVFIGSGCISTSNDLPRCVNLCFDAGNPLVKFITVAYRHNVGNDPSGSIETQWLEHETFRKYDDSTGVPWYERPYNPVFTTSGSGITLNTASNLITYTFCADKNSTPIDPLETSITEPGLPRLSSSLALIEKKLALANNVYDFQPISQNIIDAINFSAKLPTTVPCDAAPLRTIIVYSAIYLPVATLSSQHRGYIVTSGSHVVFSGPGTSGGGCGSYGPFSLDQVFGDSINAGFIAVLRGTSQKTICVQGDLDPTTGTFVATGYGTGIVFPHGCVQQYTFTGVPAGKYIIQIASHKSTINDGNLGQTSTYVAGISQISDLSTPTGLNSYAANPLKEIEIDCTLGDVVLNQPTNPLFTILSLEIGDGSAAVDGYLLEQNGSDIPIEMQPMYFEGVTLGSGVDVFGSFFTDHNGFYFGATDGTQINAYTFSDYCDGSGTQNRQFISPLNLPIPYIVSSTGGIVHGDGSGVGSGCSGVHGNWLNQVYLFPTSGIFPDAARRRISQPVDLCSTTTGLPGIPIIMSKISESQLTNSAGIALFIAHNRYNYLSSIGTFPAPWLSSSIPDYSISPNNEDVLVFCQNGKCEWNVCGSCGTSISDVIIAYIVCGGSSSGCPTSGPIGSAVINTPGLGYTVSDRVTINGGSPLATIQITAVSGSGSVTAFIVSGYGDTYTTGTEGTTAVTGVGSGLTFNIFVPAPRSTCLPVIYLRINGLGIYGVQSGGKYPVAFVLHDVIGRHTSPQVKLGDLGYVYVPNLNDTSPSPYPAMALCQLQVTIPTSLTVDSVFTKMTIWVGKNVAFSDFFTWAADWIQYVDNTGATNSTNPTAIRIYIRSINEYNKQYNQKTNVAWDFITKSANENRSDDVVQFICNGDGTYLPSVQGAPITYNKEGIFITIEYQAELAGLQNGCLFKIIRPKQDNLGTQLPYYEQSLTLPINNGLLPAGTYVIPYQDSYLLSRFIPVPIMAGIVIDTTPASTVAYKSLDFGNLLLASAGGAIGQAVEYDTTPSSTPATATSQIGSQGVGIAPGATPPYPLVYSNTNTKSTPITVYSNINPDTNGIILVTPQNYPTSFPFFFETPSPSDLWGSHLASYGRIDFPNPYEQQYRVGTEIALSNPISDKGFVNGLGVYQEQNRQIFDRNAFGDITVLLVEMGVVMVICNNDYFLTRYGQSQLQIQPDGTILGQNPNGSLFTAPQIKIGSNYGVIPKNINSIDHYNGVVVFLDNKGHLIISNFSDAKPAEKDGYMGYLLNKIATTNINSESAQFWHGRIDPKTMEYVLTNVFIAADGSETPSYINTDAAPALAHNETYIFNLSNGVMKTFASFTPEYYGRIPGYYLQRQFLSFKQGAPWIHHNNLNIGTPPPYCNFYGVQCEARITHIVNGVDAKLLPDKVKRYFYKEVYCKANIPGAPGTMPTALFYADVITTEAGQTSRLLLAQWGLKNNFYCAAYLCDLNTPPDPNIPVQTGAHAILDGNQLTGRWLQCSLVTAAGYAGTYFEVSGIVDYINGVEPSAE
jgi:hypothetical protein